MRAGEKLLNALFIFLEHVKTWNLTLTTHSRSCFFEVLIVQCQNSIKYILLRSLSAAMFTWPCKTNFTTVPDPLELQILLEDQTATELRFQSYAATTTIDRMTWLACISHYVRGHVHKTGHNYNGTHGLSCHSLKFLLRTVNSKPPIIPFGIVECTFSDNLSRNSCMQRKDRNGEGHRFCFVWDGGPRNFSENRWKVPQPIPPAN